MNRASLIDRVRAEFANVSRGLGRTLHEAIGLDKHLNGDDLNRERARDTEVHWTDVPAADIEDSPEIFSFLDFRGFAYYLPAYMVWALENYDHSDSATPDFLIYALDPHGALQDTKLSHFDQLASGQREVVAEFLRFMSEQTQHADSDAAARAIQVYWSKYLRQGGEHEG
jgi:hypothetical protein